MIIKGCMSLAFLVLFGTIILDVFKYRKTAFVIAVSALIIVSVCALMIYMDIPLGAPKQ